MGRNKKTYTDKFRIKCLTEMMEGKMCSDNNRDRKEKEEYKEKYLKAIEVIGKKEMEIELLKKSSASLER